MRVYIEIVELEVPETETPQYARVDVTDMSEEEKQSVINDLRELFSGKKYRMYYHFCYHDEELRKPCKIQIIEEVK